MKCDDQLLLEILREPTPSDESTRLEAEASLHIETCEHCQTRLMELAADPDSWTNVASALNDTHKSSSVVITVDSELAEDLPMRADRISLDFLESPTHPEMLGRIGRYEVERLIGAGGMGIVLKAFDTELHRPVAIKVLAPHLAHSGAARQRFAREAQSAAAVVHHNVVPIHNVDVASELPYLVMRYVSGESLQGRVDRTGTLSNYETLRIGAQIANGLAAAHERGLVHRDVKPGNVLLEESVDRVLISDFGLARAADDASLTRSGVIAGTPHYMSPEQARGDFVDARSDLFSLGSVLYFMLTGRPPFRSSGAMGTLNRICHDPHRPVDEVNDLVPAALAELIDALLEKQPAHRPSNALDVASHLNGLLQDKRERTRFRKQRTWSSKSKAVAAFALVLAVALGFSLRHSMQQGAETGAVEELNHATPASSPSKQPDVEPEEVARLADLFFDDAFHQELSEVEAAVGALQSNAQSSVEQAATGFDSWTSEFEAVNESADRISRELDLEERRGN